MKNGNDFAETLDRLIRARIPLITIRSAERTRVLKFLREVVANYTSLQTYVHTLTKGLCDLSNGRVVSDDRSVSVALDYAATQLSQRSKLTFVFTDIQGMEMETGPHTRELQDLVMHSVDHYGSIILITNAPVWGPLQRLGMSISLPLPTQDEMFNIIEGFLSQQSDQVRIEWTRNDMNEAAAILTGISEFEAENILSTLAIKGVVSKEDIGELARSKDSIFADISGLERVPVSSGGIQVGGLLGLRTWLERQRPLLTADLRKRHLRPPRGLLLVGVPGCGKSLSAKAIASDWNLPLYRLDLSTIYGQYVGQSENRLKEALNTADHVAPCVLWIDEIEKGLAGSSGGDSTGVSTRLVGQFLFWLQEATARVFVVATANDVSTLPQELLRRGRFDEIFFIDLPTPEERGEIISLYLRRGLSELSIDTSLLNELVKLSDGFAGADLEAAVAEVVKEVSRAEMERGPEIDVSQIATPALLRSSFLNIVPFSQTSPERVDYIRAWGRERAVPASGQPISNITSEHRGRVVLLRPS